MGHISPVKIEYILEIKGHLLKASAKHLENSRKISFYFDDKIVAEKTVAAGDFLTDDECISEIVENYCKNKTGVYADLFKYHSDKVHLMAKTLDFIIENYGIEMFAHVTVEKGRYIIELKGNHNEDVFAGTFKAENFSEVLEKVRLFISTLTNISDSFSDHINELSTDKVEEWIKWE